MHPDVGTATTRGRRLRARGPGGRRTARASPGRPTGGRTERLELRLLGGFDLRRDGRPVPLPLAGRRLVGYLALQPGPVLRTHVAYLFWSDSTEARATACLRSTLWRIGVAAAGVVERTSADVRLSDDVEVDVRTVVELSRRALAAPTGWPAQPVDALAWSSELLPDWYDDWVLLERDRLRQLRLHALERIAAQLTASGRYGEAVDAGLAAVRVDPLRETAHRALISAYLAEGNAGEAIRQFRFFADRLQRDLGLRPSPRLRDLLGPLLLPEPSHPLPR